jgi:hypothetical protein
MLSIGWCNFNNVKCGWNTGYVPVVYQWHSNVVLLQCSCYGGLHMVQTVEAVAAACGKRDGCKGCAVCLVQQCFWCSTCRQPVSFSIAAVQSHCINCVTSLLITLSAFAKDKVCSCQYC